jgi:hypothetical protein
VKTDDLIEALVEDRGSPSMTPRVAVLGAVVAGSLLAGILFVIVLDRRPDFEQAAQTYRFLFKFVVTLTLAATAIPLVLRAFRPDAVLGRSLWLILLAPALLIAAAIIELIIMPPPSWLPRLIGTNARFCLSMIPLLSIAPLLAFLAAIRQGAPANPGLAGALAGLAAAGIGATFYASHCIDDSPLFVIVWYPIAIGLVTLVGYFAGRRWLAW